MQVLSINNTLRDFPDSPLVKTLRFHVPLPGAMGSIPAQGLQIPHATQVQCLGREDPPGGEMVTHSRIIA